MTKRANLEEQFQRAVVQALGLLKWWFWHTPNGGNRNTRTAAILKSLGVLPGVSDLIIGEPWLCHRCEGIGIKKAEVCPLCKGNGQGDMVAIELKSPTGRLTASQDEFLKAATARGWLTAVAKSWKDLDPVLACVRPKNGAYYRPKKANTRGRKKKR
jgi:hypothetical protein